MRILQLGKFYPILGGVEKVMYDLMTGLSNRGIDCDMLCTVAEPGKGHTVVLNDHGRVLACRTLVKAAATTLSPEIICRLRKICNSYDIIHVHHPDPMVALALMLSGYKGKVVLHWHSDILKQKTLLKFFMPIQNWLIKRADRIVGTTPVYVAQSPYLKDVQDKVTYLPIGIAPMTPDAEKVAEFKSQYPGKKIVLSIGRQVPYKGYRYLIQAAKHLPDDYVILIGGGGPLKDEHQALIESLGLQDKVRLLGFVPDEMMSVLYGACDLFCLSSVQKTEAFAIVQIEAMSCGKPVVATKIPESGVSWVNADGESGVNVEIENPEALAEAILHVTDPQNYQRYAEGALRRFNENFLYSRMIDGCLNIYSELG